MMSNKFDVKAEAGIAEFARSAVEPHTPLHSAKSVQMEPDSPASSHMAGDSVVNLFGPESMKASSELPDRIDVVCGNLRGTFIVSKGKIIVDAHTDCPKEVAPTEFERLGGRAATKKWKRSIRVVMEDGAPGKPVGDWLSTYGLDIRASTLMPAAEPLRTAQHTKDYDPVQYCHPGTKVYKRARMSPVAEQLPSPHEPLVRASGCSPLAMRVECLITLGEYLNGRRHDMPLEMLDITEPPQIAGCDLPLGSLFTVVTERGGYDVVTRNHLWQEVAYALGLTHTSMSHTAFLLRSAYQRFLLRYERFQSSWNEFLATTPPAVVDSLDLPAYSSNEDLCAVDHQPNPEYSMLSPYDRRAHHSAAAGTPHGSRGFTHTAGGHPGITAGGSGPFHDMPPSYYSQGTPGPDDAYATGYPGSTNAYPGSTNGYPGPTNAYPGSRQHLDTPVRSSLGGTSYAATPDTAAHASRRHPDIEPAGTAGPAGTTGPGGKELKSFLSPVGSRSVSLLPKPSPIAFTSSSCGTPHAADLLEPLPQSSGVSSSALMFDQHSSGKHHLKNRLKSLHASPEVPPGTAASYSSCSDQSPYYPHSPSSLNWESQQGPAVHAQLPPLSQQGPASHAQLPPLSQVPTSHPQTVHIHAFAGMPAHISHLDDMRGLHSASVLRTPPNLKQIPGGGKGLEPEMWTGLPRDADEGFTRSGLTPQWQEPGPGVSSFNQQVVPGVNRKRSVDEAFQGHEYSGMGY